MRPTVPALLSRQRSAWLHRRARGSSQWHGSLEPPCVSPQLLHRWSRSLRALGAFTPCTQPNRLAKHQLLAVRRSVPQTSARGVDGGRQAGHEAGHGRGHCSGAGRRGSPTAGPQSPSRCGVTTPHRADGVDDRDPGRRSGERLLPAERLPRARRPPHRREQRQRHALGHLGGRRNPGRPALRPDRPGPRHQDPGDPSGPGRRAVPLLLHLPPPHAGHVGHDRRTGRRRPGAAEVRASPAHPGDTDRPQHQDPHATGKGRDHASRPQDPDVDLRRHVPRADD